MLASLRRVGIGKGRTCWSFGHEIQPAYHLRLFGIPARRTGARLAADYEPPIVVDQAPEFVPVEVGSGWYLRGDISYSFNDSPFEDFSDIGFDVDHVRFGGGWRRRLQFHRHGPRRRDARTSCRATKPGSSPAFFDARLENQVWTGMANGYVDLGTYVGLTPYLGAGLGIMYSRNTSELSGLGFVDRD